MSDRQEYDQYAVDLIADFRSKVKNNRVVIKCDFVSEIEKRLMTILLKFQLALRFTEQNYITIHIGILFMQDSIKIH